MMDQDVFLNIRIYVEKLARKIIKKDKVSVFIDRGLITECLTDLKKATIFSENIWGQVRSVSLAYVQDFISKTQMKRIIKMCQKKSLDSNF